jgi:hypothetical protein
MLDFNAGRLPVMFPLNNSFLSDFLGKQHVTVSLKV